MVQSLLGSMNEEIVALVDQTVQSTAIVTGQTRDFNEGSGSAWLLSSSYLVTNNHVVEHMVEPIWVRMPNQDEIRATLVGRDELTDLAVLRIPENHVTPLELRQSPPRLGEICLAFGSPLGVFPESVSLGIVSGLSRSLPATGGRAIHDVIQTDCAINPGNSGGPLVGVDGRVIGVNTAIRNDAAGIGFAVPADTISLIVPELIQHGGIERASVGVSVANRKLQGDRAGVQRIVVTGTRSNTAGDLRRGDVLLAIGGFGVRKYSDITRILGRDMIGANVSVMVWRDGAEVEVLCVPFRLVSEG